jgi:heme exporter protein B
MLRRKALYTLLTWDWYADYARSGQWFNSVLFATMTAYLVNMLTQSTSPGVWTALLWVVISFVTLQSASRTFDLSPANWNYINQLVTPMEIMVGKSIASALNSLLFVSVAFLLFGLWIGWPSDGHILAIYLSVALGTIGLSTTLCFTAAIASKTQAKGGLLAILSLPLLLPTLMIAGRATKLATLGVETHELTGPWIAEAGMAGIPLALSGLLFPYLWKA